MAHTVDLTPYRFPRLRTATDPFHSSRTANRVSAECAGEVERGFAVPRRDAELVQFRLRSNERKGRTVDLRGERGV